MNKKIFYVRIERTAEEGGKDDSQAQLLRELEFCSAQGWLGGESRVVEEGAVPPPIVEKLRPHNLERYFEQLRQTAKDSLTLLRLLGVREEAPVVASWKTIAGMEALEEAFGAAVTKKFNQLRGAADLMAEVSGYLATIRSAEGDMDNAIERLEDILNKS